MNSGAEAVETALKLCRKWAYEVKGIDLNKAEIIVCKNNFHGRTTTIISFSNDPVARKNFGPYTDGFIKVEYDNLKELEAVLDSNSNIAGFLVEPIQGEAGVYGGPPGDLYVQIKLKPHEIFKRDGLDLHCEVPISYTKAVLGGELDVPT